MPHAAIRITEHDRKLCDDHRIVLIRPEFVDLLRACRGSRVLLYQSVRKAGRAHVQVGYFASADIEDILPAADASRYAVFLKDVQAMDRQFDDDFSRFGQSIEVQGWHAAADVREISEDQYLKLIGDLRQAPFEFAASEHRIVIPRFRIRRERAHDRKSRERVYRAYEGRCAISGVAHLSRDGLCGLEAAHIVPRLLSPHERTSASSHRLGILCSTAEILLFTMTSVGRR